MAALRSTRRVVMLAAVMVIVCAASPAGADDAARAAGAADADHDDRVYPYANARYHYLLDYGFVFEHGRDRHAVELSVDASLQSVPDVDTAASFSARLVQRGFGIVATSTSYFVDDPGTMRAASAKLAGSRDDPTRKDLWSAMLTVRALGAGATELWLVSGVAGLRSPGAGRTLGATAGAELEHRLGDRLSIYGGARVFFLERGVRASEARAAIRASVFSVGYRVIDFGTGTPLRGPEAGVALRF